MPVTYMKAYINKINKSNIFLFMVFMLVASLANAQSIYEQEVKNIEGGSTKLAGYKGRKILVITLSGQKTDSSILTQLQLFRNKYGNQLAIIGVPALEEGYKSGNIQEMKKMISDRHIDLLLLTGMHVKKSSGSEQSAFMKWLTDKNGNGHFDQDVKGAGHKFFLDETGRLYAVMPPELSLQAPVIDRIMEITPATKTKDR